VLSWRFSCDNHRLRPAEPNITLCRRHNRLTLKIMTGTPADTSESTRELAVHCRGLTKTYGAGDASVTALRGLDLDVQRGELLMVVGPSGCGKTTLISVIGAILSQDSGECVVLGRDVQRMSQSERARFRGTSIGFVFQMFNLLPALSAIENVAIPLLINGLRRERSSRRWVSGRVQMLCRRSLVAVNSSVSQLRALLSMTRSWSFAMNRPATLITTPDAQ
jgi:ABC-type glutathione transport system ATPase component